MGRVGVVVGMWLAATMIATGLAWAAVQQVAADAAGEAATIALAPTGEPPATLPAPTSVAEAGVTASPDDVPPQPGEDGVAAPAPDNPAPADPVSDDPAPGAAQDPGAASAVAAVTRTVDLVGGSVTVRFVGGEVALVAAVPASGFEVDVHATGPQRVDVRFESEEHESRLVADINDGNPRIRPSERPD